MTSFSKPASRVFAAFSGIAGRIRENAARARTRRAIADLDDATLRDIGISRSEAVSIAFGGNIDRKRSHG
ncbi:MAG: DUF1127 domain-containing protein [Pseudomonadota bacterium]